MGKTYSDEDQLPEMSLNAGKGKGKKKASGNAFTNGPLRESYDLLSTAASSSTKANVKMARRLLKEYSELKSAPDPHRVALESSKRILNLLVDYCRLRTADALKNDSMEALAKGPRLFYC